MMGFIDKCWVRGDATLCVVIFQFALNYFKFYRIYTDKCCNKCIDSYHYLVQVHLFFNFATNGHEVLLSQNDLLIFPSTKTIPNVPVQFALSIYVLDCRCSWSNSQLRFVVELDPDLSI